MLYIFLYLLTHTHTIILYIYKFNPFSFAHTGGSDHNSSGGAGGGGGLPSVPPTTKAFAKRSPEDIQRDYDAIPPAVKPPSAPVSDAPKLSDAPKPNAPKPPNGMCPGGRFPESMVIDAIVCVHDSYIPLTHTHRTAPAAPTNSSDLDDLTRRLDALKRGR